MKTVFVKSYGCQMNVYDSDRMLDLLKVHGYQMVAEPKLADLVILNTCHIREKAEQKLYSDLGRLHDTKMSENPGMTIAVGGCVGQALGDEIFSQAPYVSMVFGPQTYHRLPEMLHQLNGRKRTIDIDFPEEVKFDHLPSPRASTRSAFVSVQEGCDKFCTFCVVPYTRGAEYSRPVQNILDEISALIDQGVLEIYLLGQNVNGYHGEYHGKIFSLGRLIYEIADKFPTLQRLRYTTSHPMDMHDELFDAHGDVPMLMPFLHLPVQSGSNKILEKMNRKHTVQHYLSIIEKLRLKRPDIHLSSDFICGFPGETDDDHHQTIELIKTVQYSQAYSFKYSPRPGTPASVHEDQINEDLKSERLADIQKTITDIQFDMHKTFIGKTMPILFDRPSKKDGQILGKSPYMHSVHVDTDVSLIHTIQDIHITNAGPNSLHGVLGL